MISVKSVTDVITNSSSEAFMFRNTTGMKFKEVFDLIPSELNSKSKRFFIKSINEKARAEMYENEFLWLKDAGVAIPVFNIEEPKSPLKLASSRNLFKLFSNDVGLLACQYSDGIQLRILTGDDTINYGAISLLSGKSSGRLL